MRNAIRYTLRWLIVGAGAVLAAVLAAACVTFAGLAGVRRRWRRG